MRAALLAVALLGALLQWRCRRREPAPPLPELSAPERPARETPGRDGRGLRPGREAAALPAEGAAPARATSAVEATAARARRPSASALLEELLRAGNDNDPRLDTAFEALDENERAAFRRRYAELPPESRNQRGTIVYLLGRNLRTAEDWAFLRRVVAEPPCRGLSDCAKEDGADEPGLSVTLAYPALVALEQAKRGLADPAQRTEALALLRAAKASPAAAVAARAAELEKLF